MAAQIQYYQLILHVPLLFKAEVTSFRGLKDLLDAAGVDYAEYASEHFQPVL